MSKGAYASAVLIAAALWVAAPADAQVRGWPQGGYGGYEWDRARDAGYRSGLAAGERDARTGRRFNFRDDRAYRDADLGYDGRGPRGQYRQSFRQAFEQGYRDGYYASGRYGRGTPRREPGYGYPDGRYGYPDGRYGAPGRYPDSRYPYPNGGYGGYYSPAYDKGFADGYDKGRDDGRHNREFDPVGEKWFREGDRGYKKEYGSRDAYKNAYRDAFRQGYEQGYREMRGGGYGNRYPDSRSRY